MLEQIASSELLASSLTPIEYLQIAASTTVLGAFATLVASYLARARGSNEPELSIARVKDLDQFLRECKNFEGDHGAHTGHDFDKQLDYYRARFENLLGNGNEYVFLLYSRYCC